MQKSKKVVIISPFFLKVTRGIERFCLNLTDAMVKKGCEVIIYTWGQKQETTCGILNSAIKIRKVPYCRYFRDRWASYFYCLWLKIDNPDTTILNFFYHGEEYLPKNNHYLYILHSPASQIPQRYKFVKPLIKKFTNIHIVSISQLVQQDALPFFNGKPMSLIYNGTDTEIFKPAINKSTSNKLRIITPAAYEERKGMHYLIKALIDFKYKDLIEYHIYGSGDEMYGNYLKRLITENHLENIICLKGSVTNIPELEPQYDLFALLSKGEAFALSPIEGMACGLPILVSDCAPYPEFVNENFGFMVDRENVKAIQQILMSLVEQPDLLQKMSRSARINAEKYSWDRIVEQYIKLI